MRLLHLKLFQIEMKGMEWHGMEQNGTRSYVKVHMIGIARGIKHWPSSSATVSNNFSNVLASHPRFANIDFNRK